MEGKKGWIWAGIPVVLLLVALSGDSVEPTTQQASPTPVIKEVIEEAKEIYIPSKTESVSETEMIIKEIPEPVKETYIPPEPQPAPKVETIIQESVEEPTQSCHPSYSGCLKPNASDYDCAGGSGNGPYYTGKVRVIGPDVFGLDRDKDGWGCE